MSTIAPSRTHQSKPAAGAVDVLDEQELPIHGDLASAVIDSELPVPPRRRKRRVALGILALLIVVGGSVALRYWIDAQKYESTDDATVEGRVIPISPQVAARVNA